MWARAMGNDYRSFTGASSPSRGRSYNPSWALPDPHLVVWRAIGAVSRAQARCEYGGHTHHKPSVSLNEPQSTPIEHPSGQILPRAHHPQQPNSTRLRSPGPIALQRHLEPSPRITTHSSVFLLKSLIFVVATGDPLNLMDDKQVCSAPLLSDTKICRPKREERVDIALRSSRPGPHQPRVPAVLFSSAFRAPVRPRWKTSSKLKSKAASRRLLNYNQSRSPCPSHRRVLRQAHPRVKPRMIIHPSPRTWNSSGTQGLGSSHGARSPPHKKNGKVGCAGPLKRKPRSASPRPRSPTARRLVGTSRT